MARLEDLCSKSDGQAKEVSGGCVQWVCPLCLNVVNLIFSYSIHVGVATCGGVVWTQELRAMKQMFEQSEESRATSMCNC